MLPKTALALVASALLADQAVAHSHHRHMHQQLARRDRRTEVVVVTEWKTVTVYDDAPADSATKFSAANRPQRTEQYARVSQSTAAAPAAPSEAAPTTLVTQARPKPDTPAPSPTPQTQEAPKVAETPAASPPAAVEQVPSSSGVTGGKRGLAYNDAGLVNSFANSCTKCGWAYNWDSTDNGLSKGGINFVPMLWGTQSVHTSRWNKNAEAMLAKGTTHMLSFNEPDFPAQANLSPDAAAAGHVQFMNPFSSRAEIGAPAITNSNIPGQGLDWLRSFMKACDAKGCAIDFCVAHWYSPASAAQTLFDHLEQVHQICGGRPVWLTEFAPLGSDSEITSFLSTNLPKLDSLSYLERYSYFMVNTGSLLSSSNALSSYGKIYASA